MIRALLFALVLAVPAQADPDRVSVLLTSHHASARQRFEEVNPGLFLTWENRALGLDYSLGAYRNSYGRVSVAATAAWPIWQRQNTQVALFAGVALYPRDGGRFAVHAGDWVPLAGVQMRHRNLFFQAMPGDGRFARGVVSMGLTFSLKKGQ